MLLLLLERLVGEMCTVCECVHVAVEIGCYFEDIFVIDEDSCVLVFCCCFVSRVFEFVRFVT